MRSRTAVLRLQKMIALSTSGWLSKPISRSRLAWLEPATGTRYCLMLRFDDAGRDTSICFGLVRNLSASFLIGAGIVALNSSVWRSFGSLVQISSMSGMNPMSSIRSASSITSSEQPFEHDLAAPEQVHQPARRRDQDVDALFQRLDLIAHLHAADQECHAELVILAVFLEILGDLRREFAGRLEDQAARHARAAAALGQDVDHRQHEAGGLAGAGLGDADQVAHHQYGRDRRGLDRRGFGIAGVPDRAEQFVGEAEVGEVHAGARKSRPGDGRAAPRPGGRAKLRKSQ